jgi:hypothetical protein
LREILMGRRRRKKKKMERRNDFLCYNRFPMIENV